MVDEIILWKCIPNCHKSIFRKTIYRTPTPVHKNSVHSFPFHIGFHSLKGRKHRSNSKAVTETLLRNLYFIIIHKFRVFETIFVLTAFIDNKYNVTKPYQLNKDNV